MATLHTIPLRVDLDEPESVIEAAKVECAVCNATGIEEYPDAGTYDDAFGKDLRDAMLAPDGAWLCSQPCKSQRMFEGATPLQKELLKRYELALREIDEVGPEIAGLLEPWGCYSPIKQFEIDKARTGLGVNDRRMICGRPLDQPAWIDANEPPEEALRGAITEAASVLEWRVASALATEIDLQFRFAKVAELRSPTTDSTTRRVGTVLGTVARIIGILKAALAGEVAA